MAICFTLGDVYKILPCLCLSLIHILFNETHLLGGANVIAFILVVLAICGYTSTMATVSGEIFAYAPDGGVLFSIFFSNVTVS